MGNLLSENDIQNAVERIVSVAHAPRKVVLFGSYVRAEANEDSDLDLLVVEREIDDYTTEYSRLREAIGSIGVGVDLLLYSEADFEQRRHWWTTPVYWADREGKVLYERT
jgi:uncharacterized protein